MSSSGGALRSGKWQSFSGPDASPEVECYPLLRKALREKLTILARLTCTIPVNPQGAGCGVGAHVLLHDALGNSGRTRLKHLAPAFASAAGQAQVIIMTASPDRRRHLGVAMGPFTTTTFAPKRHPWVVALARPSSPARSDFGCCACVAPWPLLPHSTPIPGRTDESHGPSRREPNGGQASLLSA